MSKNRNKKVREELQKKYGKIDMFDDANVEEKIDEYNETHKRTITTYKKFLEKKHYTGKFIKKYDNQMTVHHLQHASDGGETNERNCVVTSSLKQFYIHSLPREDEEVINNIFREYKGLPPTKEIKKKTREARKKYNKIKIVIDDELEIGIDINIGFMTPTEETIEIEPVYYQPTLEEYIEEVKKEEEYQEYKKKKNEETRKKFERWER